ncbi:MAG: hypothetical protein CL609_04990 [Anaerolineaceae bacterium]|nr:hypothetical protein [Anaerolineaceae bacterium]
MVKKILFVFILIILVFSPNLTSREVTATGNTYYVSIKTGNDANNGLSPQQAFATISKVNQLALNPDDRVLFFCGETWRADPLTIAVSGVDGNPITFGSYPEGCSNQPVLSGAIPVSGWQSYATNIYMANLNTGENVGKFGLGVNQLFRGEQRLVLGRWPNIDTADGGYSTIDGQSNNQITDAQLPSGDWTGASAHIRGMRWYILNRIVTADSGSSLTLNAAPGCWGGSCAGWGYFLNNHYNTLDQEGEWFYQESSGRLFLYTTTGKPADGSIEASVILKEDDRAWGGINLGKDLTFEGIHHVVVENLAVERWYKHGISQPTNYAHQESHHITLRNNTIRDVDGIGISLSTWVWGAEDGRPDGWRGGYGLLVENNLIERCNWKGLDTFSRESSYINNTIRDIGVMENLGASGLGCSITSQEGACTEDGDGFRIKTDQPADTGHHNLLQGNVIDTTAYNGLDIFGHNNTIKQNVFLDTCNVKGDCGAVRTFGRDSLIGTMVYDLIFDQNIILNVTGNTDGCRDDFDALFGFGFYIDHYSRNITIQDNTVSGATVHGILYQNSTGQISNNTLYNNSRTYPYIGAQIYLTGSPTFISSMGDNILFGLRSQAFTLGAADTNRINSADYNFYFNPYRSDSIYVSGSKTLTAWQNLSGQDSHSKEAWYSLSPGDPPRSTLFVNSKNEGEMINLGDRAYRDVDQQRYYGQVYLHPYTSIILIDDGLAPLSLSTISPNMVEAGSADFEMTVNGTGYTAQSIIRLNGIDQLTQFVSNQRLSVTISSADITNISVLPITVFDPMDGGLETPAINLWVVESISKIYLPMVIR